MLWLHHRRACNLLCSMAADIAHVGVFAPVATGHDAGRPCMQAWMHQRELGCTWPAPSGRRRCTLSRRLNCRGFV